MKCAQHHVLDAIATCNSCGKGLCPPCTEMFNPPTCPVCAFDHNETVTTALWRQLALMGVLFIGALIVLLPRAPFATTLLYSLMAAFFPAGWRFLGQYLSPSGGYLSPLARWLNLVVQAALAATLGLILGPIQIYKTWQEFSTIKNTKEKLNK